MKPLNPYLFLLGTFVIWLQKRSGFFANNENNTEMERKSEINAMKETKGQRDPPCHCGWAGTGGASLKLPACGSPPGGTDRTGGASPPTESEDGTKEFLLSEGVFGCRHGDDERVVPDVGLTVGQKVSGCLGHLWGHSTGVGLGASSECPRGEWTSPRPGCAVCLANGKAIPRPGTGFEQTSRDGF